MIAVLIPDEFGDLAVIDLGQLIVHLDAHVPLDRAIGDAAFDTIDLPGAPQLEAVRAEVELVRRLNETGDASAYWEAKDHHDDDHEPPTPSGGPESVGATRDWSDHELREAGRIP